MTAHAIPRNLAELHQRDEAIRQAERRATVERIRTRLGGYPILSNDTLRRTLDEEAAR